MHTRRWIIAIDNIDAHMQTHIQIHTDIKGGEYL